jgi:hypothetical protein
VTFFFGRIHLRRDFLSSVLSFLGLLFFLTGSVHSAQVTLAWDPNTEPDVAGYRIYYGLASDQYSNRIDVGNQTRYTVASLVDGKTYYFTATAYDKKGNESDFSNEVVFQVPVPCTYSVSPSGQSFTINGGPSSFNVVTQSGCAWTAVSNASWLVITSNSSVTGNGTVNYSAVPNSDGSPRAATLTVAGQTMTITQAGISAYTITASAGSNGAISPSGTLTVNAAANQTFTIRAARLYAIDDVQVDGVSQGPIASYTFRNANSNHSITASFVRKTTKVGSTPLEIAAK